MGSGARGAGGPNVRVSAAWRCGVWCAVMLIVLISRPAAQTLLDGVLFKFGDDIVTRLDVRQARLLKLADVPSDSDQAYVEALVNRRLVLADLKRSPPAEPSPEAIDAKRRQWQASLGAGANLQELMTSVGMSDAGLTGWLRDDLRIQTYIADRFGGRPADLAAWIITLRQRAGLR